MPAPTLTLAPMVASPRYARWLALLPAPERRLLELDEVADVGVLADVGAGPQMRERTDRRPVATAIASTDHRVVADDRPIADRRVDDAAAGVNLARRADPGAALEEDARVNHRVAADLDVAVDVGRGRDRSSVTPAAISSSFFCCRTIAADLGELRPAVDAADLLCVGHRNVVTTRFLAAVNRDQIGKVILALGVVRADLTSSASKSGSSANA